MRVICVTGTDFGNVGDVGAPRLANEYFAVQGVVLCSTE